MNQGGFSSATLDRHEAKMQLSIEGCQALCDGIQACMVQGLSANPATPPDLKMLPSFVTNFPNGGEEGSFVAMDLVPVPHCPPPAAAPRLCNRVVRRDCALCGFPAQLCPFVASSTDTPPPAPVPMV